MDEIDEDAYANKQYTSSRQLHLDWRELQRGKSPATISDTTS
jgi:hypothetical protein